MELFSVTRLKVKVFMSNNQTIISGAIATNVFNVRTFISYSNGRWKEGASCRSFGQNVKGQPSSDFLVALIFWQDIITHLGQCFFRFCTQVQDDERKMPRKFEDKLSLIKVSKDHCPKALGEFVDFSVLCQIGRLTYAFCYRFLMIFRCFWIFPLDRTGFFHLHITQK